MFAWASHAHKFPHTHSDIQMYIDICKDRAQFSEKNCLFLMKACISWHQKYIVPLYTYIYIELFFSDEIKISEHIFASINMHQTSEFEQLIIW